MQRRHLFAVLAAVAGLGLAGILTGPARAATTTHAPSPRSSGRTAGGRRSSSGRSDEHGKFWAGGTVTAVDASAGTVTITRLGKDGAAETISVAADAAITIDKVSGTLAGLPVGARALVTGTGGLGGAAARTATRIDAATSWPLRVGGVVVSVGADTMTLDDQRDKTTITVTVGGAARITMDGRASSLTAVPVGARVWVEGTATATSRTVMKIAGRTASPESHDDEHPTTTGAGRRAADWK